jgi:hypothetical protein
VIAQPQRFAGSALRRLATATTTLQPFCPALQRVLLNRAIFVRLEY